jgi:hypothetical protein
MSPINFTSIYQKKPYLRIYEPYLESPTDYELKKVNDKKEFYIRYKNRNLTSSIAPLKAAQRLLETKNIAPSHLVFCFGLGNPHLFLELNSKLRENQILVFIDSDPLILSSIQELLIQTLQIPGRHLFLGRDHTTYLWNYIESIPVDKIAGIRVFKNPPSIELDKDFYFEIEEQLQKMISAKMSDLLTKFEFDSLWAKNTIQNLISFSDQNKLKLNDIQKNFQNTTAVLVSAGPSLREQASILQKYREKLFIFSCDTSAKVLFKFGITPDAILTLDAQTHSYFHFLGENFTKIPLFADFVASPMLLRNISFLNIVHSITAKFLNKADGSSYKEATAGSKFAESILGDIGEVQSGGSVATSALDLLRILNFKEIYLFGQDLAYTGREIHSTGTHHNEKWLTTLNRKKSLEKINEEILRKRETFQVESVSGGTVLTDFILNIYKNWFEVSFANHILPVWNVSNHGAKIQNIPNISILEAEQKFTQLENHLFFWKNQIPWLPSNDTKINIDKKLIIEDLNLILKELINQDFQKEKIQSLLDKYSFLEEMTRKTRIYIQRNEKNLEKEKEETLMKRSLIESIYKIKRAVWTFM